ncbi:unnamed protein product [Paramecium sonneborni]|uniref:Uncharacterized protein n=1 Tax=Paramecium sonneborni TaxID=65129 RepID=A0A8S1RLS9_9CILI|nr:unnamed protein product [Paramecium sonneborni]
MIQQQSQTKQNNQQKHFNYQILLSISQQYLIHTFTQAINKNNTLLVIGSNLFGKVIYLKNELKYLQQNKKHSNSISTLNFFKRKSQFISGSYDSSIIIQSSNLLQNLKYLTKLKGHMRGILCLVVDSNSENLIISGATDNSIKFWSYSQYSTWSCSQTIREHTSYVFGLSINQDGTKLVSCGRDKQILLMERFNGQLWYVKQKISELGSRISFITKDIFVFQPCNGTNLQFYTIDLSTGLYTKSKELQVQGAEQGGYYYFPKFIYLLENYLFLKMDILQIQYSLTLILKIGIVYMSKEQNLINVKILETFLGP